MRFGSLRQVRGHRPGAAWWTQFGTNVFAELDYTGEAYNAFRLAKNMEGLPGVHVPKIYPELSTSRVLTLEFIHGVKISNIEAIEKAGLDRASWPRNALRAIVKQLLIDGFFHADPHPGNVLIDLQTGVITFIDTGMVGELERTAAREHRPAADGRAAERRHRHGAGS